MGYKIIRAKVKDQLKNYFMTVQRDPSTDASEGKELLRRVVTDAFTRPNIKKMTIVAEQGSKTEYLHYHVVLALWNDVHWKKSSDYIQNKMYFDKGIHKDGKRKGKRIEISVWVGKGRKGDVDTYSDWVTYVSRPGVKLKDFDDEHLHLEEDPIFEEFLEEAKRNPTIWLQYISKIDGVKRGYFSFM